MTDIKNLPEFLELSEPLIVWLKDNCEEDSCIIINTGAAHLLHTQQTLQLGDS